MQPAENICRLFGYQVSEGLKKLQKQVIHKQNTDI